MGFIINKSIKYQSKHFGDRNKTYYYLVEGYRQGKRVKRKTIYSLGEGKNLTEALEILDRKVKMINDKIKNYERRIEEIKQGRAMPFSPPWRQYRTLHKWMEEEKVKIQELEKEKGKVRELIMKYPNCCAKTLQ